MHLYIYICTYTCVSSLIVWFAPSFFVSLSHCHNAAYWVFIGGSFNNVLIFGLVRMYEIGTYMRCKHIHVNLSIYIHTHIYIYTYVY